MNGLDFLVSSSFVFSKFFDFFFPSDFGFCYEFIENLQLDFLRGWFFKTCQNALNVGTW